MMFPSEITLTTSWFASESIAPWIEMFGWMLLHFVWQGACVALVTWSVLQLARHWSANARYLMLCAGMLLMLACPVATLVLLQQGDVLVVSVRISESPGSMGTLDRTTTSTAPAWQNRSEPVRDVAGPVTANEPRRESETVSVTSHSHERGTNSPMVENPFSLRKLVQSAFPAVVILWSLGVVFLSLRFIVHWSHARRLQSHQTVAVEGGLQRLVDNVKRQFGIQYQVVARISECVDVPLLIGWMRPVILLPTSAITGLSTDQLRAILAHELAHVRRADYMVNLVQTLAEIVLFYHPAVWWLSHRIRVEREHCCDDLAARTCENPRQYALALLQLEKTRGHSDCPALAIGSDGGSLKERIGRLIGRSQPRTGTKPHFAGLVVLLIVMILGISLYGQTSRASHGETESDVRNTASEIIDEQENERKGEQEDEQEKGEHRLLLKVVDVDGKPIRGAKVLQSHAFHPKGSKFPRVDNANFEADENGHVELKFDSGNNSRSLRIWVAKDRYATVCRGWEEDFFKTGKALPTEFTFQLPCGIKAGGFIRNADGEPIVGAKVELEVQGQPKESLDNGVIYPSHVATHNAALVTDKRGYWETQNVPPFQEPKFSIRVTHPRYISDGRSGTYQIEQGVRNRNILACDSVITMSSGISIRGKVFGQNGKPVNQGLVIIGNRPYWQEGSQEFAIDGKGNYKIPTQKPGKLRLTVVVPAWKPVTRVVDVSASQNSFDFKLVPGNTLAIKCVDESGKAIAPAFVRIAKWKGVESLYNIRHPNVKNTQIPFRTDQNGLYQWHWAPDELTVALSAPGYHPGREHVVKANGETHVIRLKKQQVISGTVVDRKTGAKIDKASVMVAKVSERRQLSFQRTQAEFTRRGKFEIRPHYRGDYRLLVEAPGYRAFKSDVISSAADPVRIELTPAAPIRGRVVDQHGKPMADTLVAMNPKDREVMYPNAIPNQWTSNLTRTNKAGEFEFVAPLEPFKLFVRGNDSCAIFIGKHRDDQPGEITLKPLAKVSGTLMMEGKPAKGVRVSLQSLDGAWYSGTFQFNQVVNPEGGFEFTGVPAGSYTLATNVYINSNLDSSVSVPLNLKAGQEMKFDLSPDSTLEVRGKLPGRSTMVGGGPTSARLLIEVDAPAVPRIPGEPVRSAAELVADWTPRDSITVHGLQQIRCYRYHRVRVRKDGTFSIKGLKPGRYAFQKNDWELHRFKVTDADIRKGVLDLGTLSDSRTGLKPGEAFPDFRFTTRDGEKSLKEFRGKHLVIVYADHPGDLNHVSFPKLRQQLKDNGASQTRVLLLTFGKSSELIRNYIRKHKINAIPGTLGKWSDIDLFRKLDISWVSGEHRLIDDRGRIIK